MMFQTWRRMAALIVLALSSATRLLAQTPAPKVPVVKAAELARSGKRPAPSSKAATMASEKKKAKKFSYANLLPFGVGQFEQNKTILGTALAAGQAGFLLLYFDRLNAVRTSNADAADVMRGVDMNAARNDPTTLAFLDQNEKFTLQAQQQARMAILGFFALYTAGVVEAVFDPLAKFNLGSSSNTKKKKKDRDKGFDTMEAATDATPSRLVQELRDEQKQSKVGVFYQPAGSQSAIGLSLQKPL